MLGISKNKCIKLWNIGSLFEKTEGCLLTNDDGIYKPKPFFKLNFADLDDYNINNKSIIETTVDKTNDVKLKKYTNKQLTELGDDMKKMIYRLDTIEQLMPGTGKYSRGIPRVKRLRTETSKKPRKQLAFSKDIMCNKLSGSVDKDDKTKNLKNRFKIQRLTKTKNNFI